MGTVHHAPACSVASTTVPIQEPQPACFCKFLGCRRLARALSVQMANTGQRYRVAQLMIGERTRGPALALFQSRRLWVSAADRRQSRSAIPIFATAQGASMYSRAWANEVALAIRIITAEQQVHAHPERKLSGVRRAFAPGRSERLSMD